MADWCGASTTSMRLLLYLTQMIWFAGTSAHLAIAANGLAIKPIHASQAILKGYTKALEDGGFPYVLADKHEWLRATVVGELRNPVNFWNKLNALPSINAKIPGKVRKALEAALPNGLEYRVIHREAGLGSLGHPRFMALANWHGGLLAREAKKLAPSAHVWLKGKKHAPIQYERIVEDAIRCPDPCLNVSNEWVVRRLAPDCSGVELDAIPKDHDQHRLLEAMGRETANVHLGSGHDQEGEARPAQ